MKQLIIYTHLNPKSFTKAVSNEVEKVLKEKGDEVKTIDLYQDKFNPVLEFPDIEHMFMGKEATADVKKYQELVSWADNLVFVYPLWWSQMPAMLKGFIDRVFSNGYAYVYTETGVDGLLKGKTANLFINTGNPSDYLDQIGMHAALKKVNEDGIFGFCGITAKTTFFGSIAMGTDEDRKAYLESIKNALLPSVVMQ